MKLINKLRKGNLYEHMIMEYYEALGCNICFKAVHVRYHSNDFAGLFDLVVLPKNSKDFVLVSVKAYKPPKAVINLIKDFSNLVNNTCLIVYFVTIEGCFYFHEFRHGELKKSYFIPKKDILKVIMDAEALKVRSTYAPLSPDHI